MEDDVAIARQHQQVSHWCSKESVQNLQQMPYSLVCVPANILAISLDEGLRGRVEGVTEERIAPYRGSVVEKRGQLVCPSVEDEVVFVSGFEQGQPRFGDLVEAGSMSSDLIPYGTVGEADEGIFGVVEDELKKGCKA